MSTNGGQLPRPRRAPGASRYVAEGIVSPGPAGQLLFANPITAAATRREASTRG